VNAICPVCIRACPPGRSFCGRRDAGGNLIVPNTYQALRTDRLFDKPLIHYADNLKVLSLGSWGCNLRCLGCQNARLSWTTTGHELESLRLGPREAAAYALAQGCRGLCYTFNEPAILLESVTETAAEAKAAGLRNILVTNCTLTVASAGRIGTQMDAVAADIKSMEDGFYYEYCGAEGIADVARKILDCIRAFREAGCHLEVRTNVIPGANDQDGNFEAIAGWIIKELGQDVPWHITRFFPAHYLGHLPATPAATILRAQRIGRAMGLAHVNAFLSKGCDCATDVCFINGDRTSGEASLNDCCSDRS